MLRQLGAGLVLVWGLVACGGGGDGGADAGGGGGGSDAGTAGLYSPQLPADVKAFGFAVVKQGSHIIAVGSAALEDGGTTGGDFLVARFDTEARLDTTFGEGGMVLLDARGEEVFPIIGKLNGDGAHTALVDGDQLVIAGSARGWSTPGAGSLGMARFSADGVLDTSFGNADGMRIDTFRDSSGKLIEAAFSRVLRQSDGKYLAGGNVQGNFLVVRYNADGSADTTFSKTPGSGFGNAFGSQFDIEAVRGMVLQSTGRVVVAGGEGLHMARLQADGQLDTSFGTGGYVRRSGGDSYAVFERSDGKLLMVGAGSVDGENGSQRAVIKLLQTSADGVPDASFGTDGLRDVRLPINPMIIRGAAHLEDGTLVLYLAGIGTYLTRITPSGELDTSFGSEGGVQPLGIKLPLLQPFFTGTNHLLVDGNVAWIADISGEKYAEPNKTKNFFVLRRFDL